MSVPMSQYEALLEEVRCLRRKAQHVQQLAAPLISTGAANPYNAASTSSEQTDQNGPNGYVNRSAQHPKHLVAMESLGVNPPRGSSINEYEHQTGGGASDLDNNCSGEDDEYARPSSGAHMSVSSEPITSQRARANVDLYHGTWPVERTTMWNSEPTNLVPAPGSPAISLNNNRADHASVMSFASSSGGAPLDRVLSSPDRSRRSSQQLETKMDMVYSLLAMLGGQEHADMGETLLALSTSPESCLAMRQSGCIPLLVQLVQSDKDADTRKKASQALYNLVHSQPDEKLKKRESRVLKLLEQARSYTEALKNGTEYVPEIGTTSEDGDKHPTLSIAHLMKLSFDEGHRQAICQLGGIHVIANLVETEHSMHGSTTEDTQCVLMRRYACMALTNLTFGDSGNKALLCSFKDFMRALVTHLRSTSDELRQVTASVLRNLSWRADPVSKEILREVGTVTGLIKSAMLGNKENTLKSILSALWNLSAHCTDNKSEICAIEGALGFLVDMLSYKTPSKSLAVIENSGGILRNISSQIAVREDYREILRQHNCLQVLLEQLKSPSLTIVSNACGTLWNLSAKNVQDQEALWQMGAPAMLRSLNHSKHKMIAMGSSAALKNLLSSRPAHALLPQVDTTAKAMDLPVLPTLGARKQKALLQDLDQSLLHETYDNIESPTKACPEEKYDRYVSTREFIQKTGKKQQERQLRRGSYDDSKDEVKVHLRHPNGADSRELPNLDDEIFATKSLRYNNANLSYSKRNSFVRNSYSDFDVDSEDVDPGEEPIDFSRKYDEIKSKEADSSDYIAIYAETDLDQPTDYSLRYAEDNSSGEDSCCEDKKVEGFVRDTIKTYYTEGTPYETPFNFSTATSMSDLRESNEKAITADNDKVKTVSHEVNKNVKEEEEEEKDRCSVEDVSENERKGGREGVKLKSHFSSGLMSPEKPVNYCEEGTPGYFSRVSSFGSLNSIATNENVTKCDKEAVGKVEIDGGKKSAEQATCTQEAGKAVKFEQTVNYAEETPLMFSRSSSLASLDSVEQHSIHDDRSSVISDFSRLTSGLVSPSELPDSPSQTVPPSPKPRKTPLEYPPGLVRTAADGRPQPAPRMLAKSAPVPTTAGSVFEDNVTKFKEESTPVQFSTATSLSSLTIDDNDESLAIGGAIGIKPQARNVTENESATSGSERKSQQTTPESKQNPNVSLELNDDLLHISDNENDDDILADCINIGMQNSRHRQNKENQLPTGIVVEVKNVYAPKLRPQLSGIPLPRSAIPARKAPPLKQESSINSNDTLRTYCTEDTPAVLSHAGSNSDLSAISIPQEGATAKKEYLSDDSSSNLSADNDNILAECIQSAMPKPKRVLQKVPLAKISSIPIKPTTNSGAKIQQKIPQKVKTPFTPSKDETERFAVEDTPCQFSLRSSLSDLTVESNTEFNKRKNSKDMPGSSTSQLLKSKEPAATNLSREASLSSLSVESVESLEAEQALLEQCISSGMPKGKSENVDKPSPVGVARYKEPQADPKNAFATSVVESTSSSENRSARLAPPIATPPQPPPTTADVAGRRNGGGADNDGAARHLEMRTSTTAVDITSPTRSIAQKSSGSDESDSIDDGDGLRRTVSNRMLDPDAMIESLDRFTAELVSQAASHLQQQNRSVIDGGGGDTWNEDVSPNDVTFPSISGSAPNVITFSDEQVDELDAPPIEPKSNDFSSINTTSTMTESTLIAIEATRIASNLEVESGMSISATSFELDAIRPPSRMDSLTNSANDLEGGKIIPKPSQKSGVPRKRSLPTSMVRRALGNSFNQGSSSVESLSNLDNVNAPSIFAEVDFLDLESSLTSVASLQSEVADVKGDFMLNGIVNNSRDQNPVNVNPIFAVKQPVNMLHLFNNASNCSELEQVNPPSLLNEITDLCDSLADAPTEVVTSEADLFEDCFDATLMQTEDDVATHFSDANSATPIQTDSSKESSPKRSDSRRVLTAKERRNIAKDRYMTYTVDAEELAKLTPKERRQSDRSRFETRIIDAPPSDNSSSSSLSPGCSPVRTKLSIRRNFLQKRLENRDRFKTKVISESSLSPEVSTDLHALLRKEANVILKSLDETKTKPDELLDCETLSLVSNEDDSEHNSGCSVNYRTYHKSWGIVPESAGNIVHVTAETNSDVTEEEPSLEGENDVKSGPKIVKPKEEERCVSEEEQQPAKAIRGRRKPLYSKVIPAPSRIAASSNSSKISPRNKPPLPKSTLPTLSAKTKIVPNSKQGSPSRGNSQIKSPNQTAGGNKPREEEGMRPAPLERQGTFTLEEGQSRQSKIPQAPNASSIPKPSRIARAVTAPPSGVIAKCRGIPILNKQQPRAGLVKSASSDRANKSATPAKTTTVRSPSADARDTKRATIQSARGAAPKKGTQDGSSQRSSSNSSLTSNGSGKQQAQGRIAWRRGSNTNVNGDAPPRASYRLVGGSEIRI